MNAIETFELTRSFGGRTAVDKLALSIPVGSVFGFLGPNGAGKTTTVRMLTAQKADQSSDNGTPPARRSHDQPTATLRTGD